MSKHILGLQILDTPYKLIAADIDNSGSVSILDAIILRRVLLNIEQDFRNNTSWRFVPATYLFPDPENPWKETFPEVININELTTDRNEEDFIAIKIGDLNGDVNLYQE